MATSGYDGREFIVSSWGTYSTTMTCTWQLLSQNATNNTSTIRLRHYFYYGGGTRVTGSGGSSYTMDGQTTNWSSYTCYPGYTLIQTKDITVTHNSDGTFPGRYVSISASGYTNVAGCSGGGTITGIPTIPRAATINSFTGNDVDGNFSVTYTKKSNSFTHKLRISIPSVKALETFNYNSGTSFTLTDASKDYIYNYAKTNQLSNVTLGAVIETWNGSSKVGESSELKNSCTLGAIAKLFINNEYKRATPYVRVNGAWKRVIPYIRVNNEWKRSR